MISIFAPSDERRPRCRAPFVFAVSWVLLAGGIILLAYAGYVIAESSAYQRIEMRRFEYPKPSVPRHILAEGDVIGEIQILRLGFKAIVVQGDSPKVLRRAVGHLSETALPGESGNVALAGHRDTFFRPLRQIRPGDIVAFKIPGQQFRYEVKSTHIVSPNDNSVLQSSTARELTLITCYPFGYIGPAPDRFVVRAQEIAHSP